MWNLGTTVPPANKHLYLHFLFFRSRYAMHPVTKYLTFLWGHDMEWYPFYPPPSRMIPAETYFFLAQYISNPRRGKRLRKWKCENCRRGNGSIKQQKSKICLGGTVIEY